MAIISPVVHPGPDFANTNMTRTYLIPMDI